MVRDLYRAGHLSAEARDLALDLLRPPRAWWTWADRIMLCLGAALVLAGIVFFFAYNWSRLSPFAKFGLIQAGIVISVAGAHKTGWDSLAGKVLLLSASVLTGTLLAVYGQVYQTGADAFELFLGWAALIFPWVVLARFGGLWILWLAVLNTGLSLYWVQVLEPNHKVEFDVLFLALAFINGLALAGREIGLKKSWTWLSGGWLRDVLWLAVLIILTIPGLFIIIDGLAEVRTGPVALIVWAGASAAGYFLYRTRLPDLRALAYLTLSICVVILTGIGRVLFEESSGGWTYLFFGVIIVVVMSLATLWLRRVRVKIAGESHV